MYVHVYVCTMYVRIKYYTTIAKYNLFYYITILNNNSLLFIKYSNFRIQIKKNGH